jgi:hypothetical protein
VRRYLPPSGFAQRNFFLTQYLGVPSANTNAFIGLGCNGSPNANPLSITVTSQNDGRLVPAADRQFALMTYANANWNAQKNGVDPIGDGRNGVALEQVCTGPALANCKKASQLNEVASKAFFGQRPVSNVLRHDSPSYAEEIAFAGVNASGNGFVCSTDGPTHKIIAKLLKKFGYKGLKKKPAGSGLPLSYCRKQ